MHGDASSCARLQEPALHLFEAPVPSASVDESPMMESTGPSVGSDDTEVGQNMNIARKVAFVVATATLGVGLLGISAPANADMSWGYSVRR